MINPDTPKSHDETAPPWPRPETADQSKLNLAWYRQKAGYSQHAAARALGMSQAYYWLIESLHSESDKAIDLPWRWLQPLARLFDCPPDLIDPLCSENLGSESFPAIIGNGKVYRCIEKPCTADDYANNFRYFFVRSGLSIRDLADRTGLSESSLSKWNNGGTSYRGDNIFRALEAMGCIEYRDLIVMPKKSTLKGAPITLKDGSELTLRVPAITLLDLKNNLHYHLANRHMRPYNLDNLLHMAPGTARKWIDPGFASYMTASQAKVVASVYKCSEADISPDVLTARFGEPALPSNSLGMASPEGSFLNIPVGVYASGGPAIGYPAAQSDETVATYLNYHSAPRALRSVTVVGNSMYNFEACAGYQDGMLALVDTSITDPVQAVNRVVCWQTSDNEIMIKRLKRIKGALYICSDNPDFQPNQYPVPKGAILLGVVIGGLFKD